MRVERVVVTGGRGFTDGARIGADLRALLPLGLRRLGNGGARGADHEARLAWERLSPDVDGWALYNYPVEPARDGPWPAAGCRRNVRMLEAERPDLILAYPDPDSRGTWHCIREALRRDIVVALWAPHMDWDRLSAKVGPGHGLCDDEPRFIIARAPITPHERCVSIAKWLRGIYAQETHG